MNKEELELMESMEKEQQAAQEAKELLNRVIDDGTLSMELVRDVLAIMADKDSIMRGSDDAFSMIVNAVMMQKGGYMEQLHDAAVLARCWAERCNKNNKAS